MDFVFVAALLRRMVMWNKNILIDMLDELKKGNNTYLSTRLKSALKTTKEKNLQSLLIVNNNLTNITAIEGSEE